MNPQPTDADPSSLASLPSALPVHRARWVGRVVAGNVAVLAIGLLAVAARLVPDPAGYGTHVGLGLAPCSYRMATGRPCPTCGMTTAFACFVRGDLLGAVRAQLLGAVLAGLTLLAALGGAAGAIFGVDFAPVLRPIFVDRVGWLYVLLVLGVISWAVKMATG